jgi:uncharacterized protein YjbI with pentapeptide repeats
MFFGIDVAKMLTGNLPDESDLYFGVNKMQAAADLHLTNADLTGTFGPLTAAIDNASLDLQLELGLDFIDPNPADRKIRWNELSDLKLKAKPSGSLEANLPFSVAFDSGGSGFDLSKFGTPVVHLESEKLFNDDFSLNAPEVTIDAQISPDLQAKILDVLLQFDSTANSIISGAGPVLDYVIPLVQKSVRTILGIGNIENVFAVHDSVAAYFASTPTPTVRGLVDLLNQKIQQATSRPFVPGQLDCAEGNFYGQSAIGFDFRGFDLRGANLRNANLSGANLAGVNLFGANLTGANLTGANLRGVNFTGAVLNGADLTKAFALETNFKGITFDKNTKVAGLLFNKATTWIDGSTNRTLAPYEAWGQAARLFDTLAVNKDFKNYVLTGFDLSGLDLSGLDLSGLDLTGANLRNTVLKGTKLAGTRLNGALALGVDLSSTAAPISINCCTTRPQCCRAEPSAQHVS